MFKLLAKATKKPKRKKPYYESERRFMRKMRRKGIKLLPYPKKFFVVEAGRPTTYTPDFQEIGTNRYYEVTNKSECFERNKRKYDSFRELNPELELINVKPNGGLYIHARRRTRYTYKEKTYYFKKHNEVYAM